MLKMSNEARAKTQLTNLGIEAGLNKQKLADSQEKFDLPGMFFLHSFRPEQIFCPLNNLP